MNKRDILHAVPAPSVNITGVPTNPLFSGTSLSLTCTFELHNMIDSPLGLNGVWERGGEVLNSDRRVSISTISLIRPSTYQTTLSISPLSNTLDNGQYTCQSVLVSGTYVLYAEASQQVTVSIGGTYASAASCKGRSGRGQIY